jgi:protein-S-isoprenylcysteine O-methyltransferase Ste14
MLMDNTVAAILLACLGFFFSVNLHNILVVHRRRDGAKSYAEVERPSDFVVNLAAVGTLVYFLEAVLYPLLVFTGHTLVFQSSPFNFRFSFMFYMQILGLGLSSLGYFLFLWSVVIRGRHAVSWEMPESQRLVTSGPYRYVRHPSYLGYFLMFFGLVFLWPNLFTLFPLVAIPGYFRVTLEEERLLVARFGDEYSEYQARTGRFFPKF